MKKIGDFVCQHKWMIIIITLLLLIPAFIGMEKTKINYDILVYLPEDIETLKGQKILTEDFNMGAFSITIVENMASKDILRLEDKIKKINGVDKVVSIHDLTGTTIPIELLPKTIQEKVTKNDSELMLITFKESTSDEVTLSAVEELRNLTKDTCKIGGMSSMVLDTKELFNSEMTLYIVIAVTLCILVLLFSLDSYLVPFLLILNIGVAILLNMGTNIFFGEICYITKAISSVLQLGVTTDFSIFLYHKYEKAKKLNQDKNKAMSEAIYDTLVSVFGSSLTTIAGFLALCTMNLTLGKDIGVVMAKGVLFGLICVVTLFPALLLVFDKQIEKTTHKEWLPSFKTVKTFVIKHYKVIFILFLILLIPAYICQNKTEVYYNLDKSIPDNYEYTKATKKLKEDYGIVSQEILLVDQKMKDSTINKMVDEIKKVDGIDMVLSPSMLAKRGINNNILNDDIKNIYETDKYKMILVSSKYEIATNELNKQITEIQKIVDKYDKNAIIAGEGPLMNDLVAITDEDFHNVNYTSIIIIFILMIIVLKSISLPIILVTIIEFAIFVNMGIPYLTDTTLPFIASVVIGTIQLGATIDYAILMTTKYIEERKNGKDKFKAAESSLDHSINSIFVSGMCFFAATIGVGVVSKIDMIASLCTLISRGAIISMIVVIAVVPAFLIVFDSIICKTTKGLKEGEKIKMKKNRKKVAVISTALIIGLSCTNVNALTKEETVFGKLDSTGKVKNITVNEHLSCIEQNSKTIEDVTNLKNILNINGDEEYKLENNHLTFNNENNEIYYTGNTDQELPIKMDITYTLDGKELPLKKLLGKKGKVQIKIHYTNTSSKIVAVNGKSKTLYTPFVVTLGTVIQSDGVSNVEVSNGKIISNGSNHIIVALATPGLSNSLNLTSLDEMDDITISYDTDNFSLNSLYSVVSPKLIDQSDLSIFNQLDKVYNSVDTLTNSTNQLIDGSNTLMNGLVEYNTKYKEYDAGVKKLLNGTNTLANGYQKLDNGIQLLSSNISKIESLVLGLQQLSNGLYTLNEKSTQLDQLSSSIIPVAIQLLDSSEGRLLISGKISEIDVLINQTTTALNNATTESEKETLTKQLENLNMQKQSISNLTVYLNTIKDGITGITTGINQSYTGISTISTNQNNIQDLINGLNALSMGSKEFHEGFNTLSNSISTISSYTDQLMNANETIVAGSKNLTAGLILYNNEGISKITNYIDKDMKELTLTMKELINLGEEYSTYTMKNESDEGSTKFILIVDGEKKPEKTTVKKKNPATKKTLWNKLTNIFQK